MSRFFFISLCVFCSLQAASKYDQMTTQQKIEVIEQQKATPGAQIEFSEKEMNAYIAEKAKQYIPEGIRDTKIDIESGRATGSAMVDFVKMKQAKGQDLGWMMSWLLKGERSLKAVGKLTSADGTARVDLEAVEVNGVAIKGRALELLLSTFVTPIYPQAKVGQPFELGHNMDRIELRPDAARVVIAGPPSSRAD